MTIRFVKMLNKIPNILLLGLLLISSIVSGLVVSKINLTEASITKGFTPELFVTLIICYSIIIICNLFDKLFQGVYKHDVLYKEYNRYLSSVLNSKMSDIQTVSTGKIFDAVKDIASLTANLRLRFVCLIPTVFPFLTLIYKEIKTDWRMAVISISSIVLGFVLTMISDRLFHWNTEGKKKKANLQGVTVDNFMNIKTIKYLGQSIFAKRRHKEAHDDASVYMISPPKIMYYRLIDIVCIAPLLINLFLCRNDVNMIAFLLLSNYTLDNMRGHILDIADMITELNAQKNVIGCLKGDDDIKLPTLSSTLKISNVMFDYGEDSEKFYIDNLEFPSNSRTLVYGESGEGKSSLANLIAGGIHPTTGHIDRYKTYYIWQETESLDDTLWNNIVFDNCDDIREDEVIELFKSLHMIEWFSKLKDGFQTQIGERGCRLSSGQKQRLNIIRLILTMRYHPEMIFIIDEITSNLDSATRELAINLIDKECHSTLICISHNEGFDKICDRQVLVKNHKFIVIK